MVKDPNASPHNAAAALAHLWVEHGLAKPIAATVNAQHLAHAARLWATGWDDARLEAFLAQEVAQLHHRLGALEGSVAAHLHPGWLDALAQAVAQPVPLNAALLMRVLDQPAVRQLLETVLHQVLMDFVRKASTPLASNPLVGGVLQRARGMMQNSLAGGLVTAVGESLGAEAERRVKDQLDDAVSAALALVVAQLANPKQGAVHGDLRAAMLRSAAQAPVTQWAAQVAASPWLGGLLKVAQAVRDSVVAPTFEAWLEQRLPLLGPAVEGTWGAWLRQAGLQNTTAAALETLLTQELEELMAVPAFGVWLQDHATAPGQPKKPAQARKPAKAKRH